MKTFQFLPFCSSSNNSEVKLSLFVFFATPRTSVMASYVDCGRTWKKKKNKNKNKNKKKQNKNSLRKVALAASSYLCFHPLW